jgi:phage tail-like protein
VAKTGTRSDPFPAFHFEVRFDDLPAAGFSECNGLTLEIEVQDHPEGGVNDHSWKFAGRTKQTNLTLIRGIVDRTVWDWFWDQTRGIVHPRNASIVVLDDTGARAMEWQAKGAFPVKWTGPPLNASQNNVAVETVEFAHQGLERTL